MRRAINLGMWTLLVSLARPPVADACGGLFCGQPQPLQQQQPVDQMAERILFRVKENAVTMVVQIAYTGAAPDFAWVLPLGNVPDPKSLNVFPQRGLNLLDASTSLRFIMPVCVVAPTSSRGNAGLAAPASAAAGSSASAPVTVTVHYQQEVGPYDVAAVESEDPMALYQWLHDNGYNVNESMLPYIRTYTSEGMKFLALKLKKDKDSNDIQPFRFDLPGTTPSIPLRMTGLAAEPEMSILVFVAADSRYNGANWPQISIKDSDIAWRVNGATLQTNWDALIARGVDEADGQGWVTESAGPAQQLVQNLTFMKFSAAEDMAAVDELLDVIESATYLTRLHTRLSAEEMTLDPAFKRVASLDVSSTHQLSKDVRGVNQCPNQSQPDPCAFTSCGAGGLCRPVMVAGQPRAACACVEGSTARTTLTPPGMAAPSNGDGASVSCQDLRMSFSNPGGTVNGVSTVDPCLNFDCGPSGVCAPVNMTPTCICDPGYVAFGSLEPDGSRSTVCTKPMIEVPNTFYNQRLPDLPEGLPGGRATAVDRERPVVAPKMTDLSSTAMPSASGATVMPVAGVGGSTSNSSDGCNVGASLGTREFAAAGLYAAGLALWLRIRRRRGIAR